MTEEERPPGNFRDVSDLRTQYYCEYRLFLRKQYGDKATKFSLIGTQLHQKSGLSGDGSSVYWIYRLALIFITITAGILWILW